jgi:ComF family protein
MHDRLRRIPFTQIAAFALDLIYPPRCAGCGRLDQVWCAACAGAAADAPLFHAFPTPPLQVISASPHTGVMREAVHVLKFTSGRLAARTLANAVIAALPTLPDAAGARVIAVPLHRSRQRERGYNQSDLLARAWAARTGGIYQQGALVRTRDTGTQVGRNGYERAAAVRDAFAVSAEGRAAIAGATCWLIDDVLTSGATLQACRAALHAAGAGSVLAYTLTAAPIPADAGPG